MVAPASNTDEIWVEKVGGTSVSNTSALLGSVIQVEPLGVQQRVVVVSAYAGVTNALLEHKHQGGPGVFTLFRDGWQADDPAWEAALTCCALRMKALNAEVLSTAEAIDKANHFLDRRVHDIAKCLRYISSLCAFGHFQIQDHLNEAREMLCSLGEAHSAYNTYLLALEQQISCRFIDLTGWHSDRLMPFEERITLVADEIICQPIPLSIVTGYCHTAEGLVKTYGRGYTEMTFALLACKLTAARAIIHKDVFLSSADPHWVTGPLQKLRQLPIEMAHSLAHYGMEAIHPVANAWLTEHQVPLWLKHIEYPQEPGTELVNQPIMKEGIQIITGIEQLYVLTFSSQSFVLDINKRMICLQQLMTAIQSTLIGTEFSADRWALYLRKVPSWSSVRQCIDQALVKMDVTLTSCSLIGLLGSGLHRASTREILVQQLEEAHIPLLAEQVLGAGKEMRFLIPKPFYQQALTKLHACCFTEIREQSS